MKLRTVGLFLLLCVSLCLAGSALAQSEPDPGPAPDYRRLPDLSIFADAPNGQWAGAGGGLVLETTDGSQLPIDTGETYQDLPSYRINLRHDEGRGLVGLYFGRKLLGKLQYCPLCG
ncbi:MAG: hypothetical protein M5U34_20300 [Chloroflexi bacterium]|nr:hypothetical protein [Chloroflexota bacterium]